jgi:enoyl-CoA hydratase/carnithine racemase
LDEVDFLAMASPTSATNEPTHVVTTLDRVRCSCLAGLAPVPGGVKYALNDGIDAMTVQPSPHPITPDPPVLRENIGSVGVLTLNRSETRNTLSEAMLAALGDELGAIAADRSVRAVVLAARGPAFSGGHDLKELTARRSDPDRGRTYFRDIMRTCSAMMTQIVQLPQPVIAAVQGTATAAGCQLVASCDLAVASADAKFGVSGINAGLFCSTPMVALSRNVARKHAMEMLLTGDLISAQDALRIGLVNRVVPPGSELDVALAVGRKIAGKSSHVVKIGKEAFYRQLEMGLDDAYRFTAEVMVENMLAQDAQEGIAAFIAKRPPEWQDE